MASLSSLDGQLCPTHHCLIHVKGIAGRCDHAGVDFCTSAVLRAYAVSLNGHSPELSEAIAPLAEANVTNEDIVSSPYRSTSQRNGSNGNSGVLSREWAYEKWKEQLEILAYRTLNGDLYKAPRPIEGVFIALCEDMRVATDYWFREGHQPAQLSATDVTEEIEAACRLAIDAWTNVPGRADKALTVTNGHSKNLPAKKDYLDLTLEEADRRWADRQASEAYGAFEALVADKREYSWEGLIRDGCTAVLAGLMSSGKSTLAMNLVRGWAIGGEVLERQCRVSKVLVVVSPKEFEAWSDTIHFWELRDVVYLIESTKFHFGDGGETVAFFDYTMRKWGCRTFVLDTMFDFFGMPPNTSGDSNRIAMNEQAPLLQLVRERNYSGLITGHAPKSEAKAIDPRDPEESFAGHTAWTAQHRMRMVVRRKSQGVNAIVTGLGGYGDVGIRKETMLHFEEQSRIVSLGGLFAEEQGKAALGAALDALQKFGEPVGIARLEKVTGLSEGWLRAGLNEGRKQDLIVREGKGRSTKYRLISSPSDGYQGTFEHKPN